MWKEFSVLFFCLREKLQNKVKLTFHGLSAHLVVWAHPNTIADGHCVLVYLVPSLCAPFSAISLFDFETRPITGYGGKKKKKKMEIKYHLTAIDPSINDECHVRSMR